MVVLAKCAKGDCSARCAKGDCSARCTKGDCSALRAPAISAGIRNPGFRPAYSCWLGCQMYRQPCVQARGLSVRLTTLSGQKKTPVSYFLRDRSETSAVPLLLLSKNSLSIPSFFKYEKLTGNTLTGVNRTSLLGTLSVVSSGRIVCNAVSAAFHQPAAL